MLLALNKSGRKSRVHSGTVSASTTPSDSVSTVRPVAEAEAKSLQEESQSATANGVQIGGETGNHASDPGSKLTPLEIEMIDFFVQLSRLLGQPRSLGEIYGLLFISSRPLAMDDLIDRLSLSKGSASQGLKFLRSLGAVRPIYIAGERRVHYEAVAELRNLTTRFLRDRIVPHLDHGHDRLEKISSLARKLSSEERAHVTSRVKLLQSWEKHGRRFLPLIAKLLG